MYEQIARNKRRTVALMLGAIMFLGAVGAAVGYLWYRSWVVGLVVGGLAAAVGAIQSTVAYFHGAKMVLGHAAGREVTPEEEPRLHNIVEGLSLAAGLPKPRVYVIAEQAPNALATGRDPEHSYVAVTRGLLDDTNRVQLEGVIAHEMSHVLDRDILVGTVVAALVAAIVLVSEIFLRMGFLFGFGGRDDDRGGEGSGGPLALIALVVGILLLVIAPFVALIIQFAVSREREYLADAQGAMLTRYPPGLASALQVIAEHPSGMRSANNATAHLWISQPSRLPGKDTTKMERLFSTHPPIQDRIRRLEEM